MKCRSQFRKVLVAAVFLTASVTSLTLPIERAEARFGGGFGGFRGGGFGGFHGGGFGGFNRSGFGGDFRGQGSVFHADRNFNRSDDFNRSNARSFQDDRGQGLQSAENTRTRNVQGVEQNRDNLQRNRQNYYNNDYHRGYYGGYPCCGTGWGWGAAAAGGLAGFALGSAVAADSLPADMTAINVNGNPYYYANGTYLQPSGSSYVVVPPPQGAVIQALPQGYTTVYANGSTVPYYYYNGFFYGAVSGGYQVISPPQGAMVPYLPKGYTESLQGGVPSYKYAGVTYSAYYSGGELVYIVD